MAGRQLGEGHHTQDGEREQGKREAHEQMARRDPQDYKLCSLIYRHRSNPITCDWC